MTVSLRAALPSDFDPVASLLRSSGLPLDGVRDCFDQFIVAEEEGRVIGSIGMERYGRYALLRSAAVLDSARGDGVGARLVDRIIETAKADGIEEIFLLTTSAEKYFPRFGFAPISRSELPPELSASQELRGACPDSAIVLRRLLRD